MFLGSVRGWVEGERGGKDSRYFSRRIAYWSSIRRSCPPVSSLMRGSGVFSCLLVDAWLKFAILEFDR